MSHCQNWFYDLWLVSAANKYTTMSIYDSIDEDGYDDGNKYRNQDNDATSGLESDGWIFDTITTPRSFRGGLVYNGDGEILGDASAVQYISTILKFCHKLLYTKFGVLDWCRCHMNPPPFKLIRELTTSLISITKYLSLTYPRSI